MRVLSILGLALATACMHSADHIEEAKADAPLPVLEQIADGVWIHKSYNIIEPWGLVLSQGMVIQTQEGRSVLIDTAWNDTDTNELLSLIEDNVGNPPQAAIITHAHNDKMGGVGTLNSAKIISFAHPIANERAPTRDLKPARHDLTATNEHNPFEATHLGHDALTLDDTIVQIFYPGAGHSEGNIVVYHPPSKTLFAGCLIRPGTSKNLGNTADGDISNWANAVEKVSEEFPDAEIIIPSHGQAGGRELLQHTIDLAKTAVSKQARDE